MKQIEIPLSHFVVVHTLAGMMCGFLLQWGMTGYPQPCAINAEVKAGVARVNAALQEQQKERAMHRTAPSPIPPASNELIPATTLPER